MNSTGIFCSPQNSKTMSGSGSTAWYGEWKVSSEGGFHAEQLEVFLKGNAIAAFAARDGKINGRVTLLRRDGTYLAVGALAKGRVVWPWKVVGGKLITAIPGVEYGAPADVQASTMTDYCRIVHQKRGMPILFFGRDIELSVDGTAAVPPILGLQILAAERDLRTECVDGILCIGAKGSSFKLPMFDPPSCQEDLKAALKDEVIVGAEHLAISDFLSLVEWSHGLEVDCPILTRPEVASLYLATCEYDAFLAVCIVLGVKTVVWDGRANIVLIM